MKNIITLLLFVLPLATLAQRSFTPVNMEEVKAAVSDSKATTSYTKLLARFNAFDTSLTMDEHRLLYYGAVFQQGYGAYPELKEKEINEAIKKGEFAKASLICDSVLKTYPVSTTINFAKGLSLVSANAEDTVYMQYMNRYANLLRTIASTGNGKTNKTGFKTIFVSDEYEMIYKYFSIKQHLTQKLDGICDVFEVSPSDKWTDKKIYFDVSEILKKEATQLKK